MCAVRRNRLVSGSICVTLMLFCGEANALRERLYGVHWWDYANGTVGAGPHGGWSVETVITESEPWWRAPFFVPLYEQVTTTHHAEIITRVDFNWGETVPAPSSLSASDWANKVVNE